MKSSNATSRPFPPAPLTMMMLGSAPARPSPMRSYTDVPPPSHAAPEGPPPRYPHVRAALNALARQHKPRDAADDDEATSPRVGAETHSAVVALLEDEDDEQLQAVLRETFGVPNHEVVGITDRAVAAH
jgi:hypothetical protein